MSDKITCKAEGCDKEANGPGAARGFCVRHYKQDRRGTLGVTRPICAPGESDEIDFRLPKKEKARAERSAEHLALTLSELCRRALREYIAKHDPLSHLLPGERLDLGRPKR